MYQPVYYVYGKTTPPKRSKKNYLSVIFVLLIISGISYYFFGTVIHKNNASEVKTEVLADQTIMEEPTPNISITSMPTPTITEESNGLSEAVESALIGTYGDYGIVIKNLKTGESFYQNEHTPFESGSLYKLWVMAVAMDQLRNGIIRENDVMSQKASTLYTRYQIPFDPVKEIDRTITFTVKDALYQMITISDNDAALLLTDKVKIYSVANFLKLYGFLDSHVGAANKLPITTGWDISLFYEKLYNEELADTTYTNKMLTLLKQQKLNDKIPTYLPDEVVVAHKTGELDEFTHDAGIVYAPTGDYIIVVLSKSDSPDLAEKRIAAVSRAVFEYFRSQ